MSAISSVSNPSLGYVAPIAVDSPTVAGSFGQTLAAVQAPKSWLTTAETSQAHRPNVKAFMDRTGAAFLDASELLYGVVGSNTDVRDWSAIMASSDPITAARQATAQMYGRTDITPRNDATYMGSDDTVAKEGNFAVRLLKDQDQKIFDQGLKLIDAQGLLLRDAGSTPQAIARNAWLFGFDTQPLAKLAAAAATISTSLGQAVQQASAMAPAAHTAALSSPPAVQAQAASSGPIVVATATATASATASVSTPSQALEAEPALAAQQDPQASSPSLSQVLQDAAANALVHVDSASYLSSLFKA